MAKKKRKLRISAVISLLAVLFVVIFAIVKLFDKPKTNEVAEVEEVQETQEVVIEETPTPEPTINPEEDERFFDVNSYLVVANKKHKLPDGYEPSDLTIPNVEMRYNQWSLRAEASTKLEEMFAAAQKDDVYLVMGSGYRGEDFQSVLYNNYCDQYGCDVADTISSRPGYSDHQTGLATDLCGQDESYDLSVAFEETKEGIWLKDNAHKFGFIMRYPKGKEEITGYSYEPWHFRYIGVDAATEIYNMGEFYSFEEYYGISGGDYAD